MVSRMSEIPRDCKQPNDMAFSIPDSPLDLSIKSTERAAGANSRSRTLAAARPVGESRANGDSGDDPLSQHQPCDTPLDLSVTTSSVARHRPVVERSRETLVDHFFQRAAFQRAAAAAAAATAAAAADAVAATALGRHAAVHDARNRSDLLDGQYDQARRGESRAAASVWQTQAPSFDPGAAAAAGERQVLATWSRRDYTGAAAAVDERHAIMPWSSGTALGRYYYFPRRDGLVTRSNELAPVGDVHSHRAVHHSRSDSKMASVSPGYGSGRIWHQTDRASDGAAAARQVFVKPPAAEQLVAAAQSRLPLPVEPSSKQVAADIEPSRRHQYRSLNSSGGSAPLFKSAVDVAMPILPAGVSFNESPKEIGDSLPTTVPRSSPFKTRDDLKSPPLPGAFANSGRGSPVEFPPDSARNTPANSSSPRRGSVAPLVAYDQHDSVRSAKRKARNHDLQKSSWTLSDVSGQHAKRHKQQSDDLSELGGLSSDSGFDRGGNGKISLARYMEEAAAKVFQRENVEPPTDLSALFLLQWPQGDRQDVPAQGSLSAQPATFENLMGVLHRAVERGLRQCSSPLSDVEPCHTFPVAERGEGHATHPPTTAASTGFASSAEPLKGWPKVEPSAASSSPPAFIGADGVALNSRNERTTSVTAPAEMLGNRSPNPDDPGAAACKSSPVAAAREARGDLKLAIADGTIDETDQVQTPDANNPMNMSVSPPRQGGFEPLASSKSVPRGKRLVVRLQPSPFNFSDSGQSQSRPARAGGAVTCCQLARRGGSVSADPDPAARATHPDDDDDGRRDGGAAGRCQAEQFYSSAAAHKAAACRPLLSAAAALAKPACRDAGAFGECRAGCPTCGRRGEIDVQASFQGSSELSEAEGSERWARMTNSDGRLVLVKVKYCCTHRLMGDCGSATTTTVVVQESEDRDEAGAAQRQL